MNRQKLLLCVLLLILAGSIAYSFLRSPKQQHVASLTYAPGARASAKRTPTAPQAQGEAQTPARPQAAAQAQNQPAAQVQPQAAAQTQNQTAAQAQPAVQPAAPARPQPPARPRPQGGEGAVDLALLEREQPRFSGYKRNIFSPIFRDEVKPPPFKPLPPPPKPVAKLPAPLPQPAAPPPPPPPPPPSPEELARQAAEAELSKFTFLGFLKKDGQRTVFLSKNNEIFLAKKGSTLGQFQVAELTEDAITIRSPLGGRELVIPLVENRALGVRRMK